MQAKHETIDYYLTELKLLAKNCSFCELENQIVRDRIVCVMHSEEVHQRLLRVEELLLEKAVSICHADEESKKSVQYLSDSGNAEVCNLKKNPGKSPRGLTHAQKDTRKSSGEFTPPNMRHSCNNCGLVHPKKQCPAYGKQCGKCNKLNHFAKYYKSTRHKIEAVEQHKETSNSDSLFVGAKHK